MSFYKNVRQKSRIFVVKKRTKDGIISNELGKMELEEEEEGKIGEIEEESLEDESVEEEEEVNDGKTRCPCGSNIKPCNIKKHCLSQKHNRWLEAPITV